MRFALRVLSFVLAMVMLSASFVACGGTGEPSELVGTSASGTEEVLFYKDLPQMDWEGAEYRILGRNYSRNIHLNSSMYLVAESIVLRMVILRHITLGLLLMLGMYGKKVILEILLLSGLTNF